MGRVSKSLVGKDLGYGATADNNRTILTTIRTPHDIGRTSRLGAIVGNNLQTRLVEESKRILGKAAVERELVGILRRLATVLVDVEVLAIGELGDDRHSGTGKEIVILYILGNIRPLEEIRGTLVNELLRVRLVVSLIRVVQNELMLVHPVGMLEVNKNPVWTQIT